METATWLELLAALVLHDVGAAGENFLLPSSKSPTSQLRGKHVTIAAEIWPPWFDIKAGGILI